MWEITNTKEGSNGGIEEQKRYKKKNRKVAEVLPSVITLSVNELNTTIKRQRLEEWIFFLTTHCILSTRDAL